MLEAGSIGSVLFKTRCFEDARYHLDFMIEVLLEAGNDLIHVRLNASAEDFNNEAVVILLAVPQEPHNTELVVG